MRNPEAIARVIDHAMLHPALPLSEWEAGLGLVQEFNIWAFCVKPCDVWKSVKRLERTATCVCAVVAFPHGNSLTETKLDEAKRALGEGATEIDYVINIAQARAGDFASIQREMDAMNEVVLGHKATLKAIFENAYLDVTTKIMLCKIARRLGLAYVKTSTGFAAGVEPQQITGATVPDVELMVRECSPICRVKASGGIRNLEMLEQLLDAGASRIGTSATREIMMQARQHQSA
jgi:deoxyribose-phosphate aldolase